MGWRELNGRFRTDIPIAAILVLAFVVRLVSRFVISGEGHFTSGYSFLDEIAVSLANGHGYKLGDFPTAIRPPIYPVFLSLAHFCGESYLWVVVPQALVGVGTTYCAYWIGKEIFSRRVGLIAATLTALYPYYVKHDTALQETSFVTFAMAIAVGLTLRAARIDGFGPSIAAGVALGAMALTRLTSLPFALLACLWLAIAGFGSPIRRFARAAVAALVLAVLVGGWAARNDAVFGRPILSSEVGRQFWMAHNPQTFSRYPRESIDLSAVEALKALSPSDRAALDAQPPDLRLDDWYHARGLEYVRAYPTETLTGAAAKLVAGFSWNRNPEGAPYEQWTYFLSYGPIALLALCGAALNWRAWRPLALLGAAFLGFMIVTAVFWAHTNHRTPLDVYLVVYAAAALDTFAGRVSWFFATLRSKWQAQGMSQPERNSL
jgi:4-amino-4-deoxy-L-arabinose transferase-like glycosyltransferase